MELKHPTTIKEEEEDQTSSSGSFMVDEMNENLKYEMLTAMSPEVHRKKSVEIRIREIRRKNR